MNNREKLQAQLDLLQEMKNQFSKDVFIPQGEDYASVQIDRNDKSELRVYADFNQKKFEDDVDRQVDSFFSDFIYEVEKKLEDSIQEEADVYNNPLKPHFGNPLGDVDELMNSIKAKLVESIKK
jgi:hypothetical protein